MHAACNPNVFQAALREPFPDCYAWGRGARLPRLREDLIGQLVVKVACGACHCAAGARVRSSV